METLADKWQQLSLSTEEDSEIVVEEKTLLEGIRRGENCLVGKLHSNRTIKKEVIQNTI